MAHEKIRRMAKPRCDNCCFSTFATGTGRPALICRQKKGSVGTWNIRPLLHQCPNFYPSRAAQITANKKSHHLGYFHDEIKAAKAYDRAATKFHGDFAALNFPSES